MSDHPQPVHVDPQTDGKASGSLVCGILGLACVLPLVGPIVAIVLGHRSLGAIRRSEGRLGGKGLAIGGLVTGYVGLASLVLVVPIMAGVMLPGRQKTHRVFCAGNLKQIGLGLLLYSGENQGYFPITPPGNNFEPLNQRGLLNDGMVYGCWSASELRTTAAHSNYVYVGSGLRDDVPNAPGVVLAYDRSGNHPDNLWMNALFADGHVEGAKPDGSKGWNTYRSDRPY